jgi:uncharacterized membrane protein HdeD (DUF308 family)
LKKIEANDLLEPKQEFSTKKSTLIILSGIFLLMIGIFLLNYSIVNIQDIQQSINTTNVSLDQIWNFDGSNRWWKNAIDTLFLPLFGVFTSLAGVVLFTYPVLNVINRKKTLKSISYETKDSFDNEN